MTQEHEVASRTLLAALCLLAGDALGQSSQATPPVRLPARFESYLTTAVRPSASERKRLLDGAPITKLLDAEAGKEVAVFGAVWINATPQQYVAAVNDIETFEQGGAFRISRRISTPPALEDFADLDLPDDDVADLKACRVGACEIKLGAESIERIRTGVDWTKPAAKADAEAIFRQMAFDYVTGYREGGNDRLAVYRDRDRPTVVAAEFRSMVDRMPSLTDYLPDVRRYLLEYPAAALPDSTDFLYWQETQFGLKPTIRISHLVIHEAPSETVVASKMLYASHYFWTAIELRVLAPDPSRGPGFWFVTVNRSRSDGLGGFTGLLIRGRVRNEVQKGVLAGLTKTKTMLESAAPRSR